MPYIAQFRKGRSLRLGITSAEFFQSMPYWNPRGEAYQMATQIVSTPSTKIVSPAAALVLPSVPTTPSTKIVSPAAALVLPSVPTTPAPEGGHYEIQAGKWKVVLEQTPTVPAAATTTSEYIDKIKAWLAQETIVAGYANQWFVLGGVLAYFLLRKK